MCLEMNFDNVQNTVALFLSDVSTENATEVDSTADVL